ncbi:hypothetical protein M2401_002513 [Pseudomonas sp. JUb42]|nr:hypothetical protein [Pseudomonas sp. JUb42]
MSYPASYLLISLRLPVSRLFCLRHRGARH